MNKRNEQQAVLKFFYVFANNFFVFLAKYPSIKQFYILLGTIGCICSDWLAVCCGISFLKSKKN